MISFKEITEKCSERLREWPLGDPIFADPRYYSRKISLENFHDFDMFSNHVKVCYVDGGNTEIINSPGFVVHLTRVAYCLFEDNQQVRDLRIPQVIDFFTVAYAMEKNRGIAYSVELYPLSQMEYSLLPEKDDLVFDSFDTTLMDGRRRANLSKAATASRVFAEWKLAEELCRNELKTGDVLVRDGSLQSQITGESKYANKAYSEALKRDVLFTGLAKTSTLFTSSGMPLFSAISLLAKRNELEKSRWYYHPIVEINAPDHKAVMMAVKLHPRSKHVFRYEVLKPQAEKIVDLGEIVSKISHNANDLTFPGYPYGLIEADRLARVRDEEVEPLQIQLFSAISDQGAWSELESFMRTVEAHKVINEI
ncbi:MAG: DNA double-strand break repair nuclease NurA [Promethearchaeota archaeon]